MQGEHTPGPWAWVEDRFRGGFAGLDGPDGQEVLRANSANDGDTGAAWFEDFPSDADRALISAAPDMLAALTEAAEAIAFYSGNDGVDHESVRRGALQRIRAAIAKATAP